uniref:Uncharacterized protein n=1 Tax=Rhizophora mucronata TaxID=61149 RepID=A0A2P2JNQ9_RHIMU
MEVSPHLENRLREPGNFYSIRALEIFAAALQRRWCQVGIFITHEKRLKQSVSTWGQKTSQMKATIEFLHIHPT